jgi:hypothetical protein
MNRRFARDAKSLDAYYHALAQEMAASLNRANVSEALKADRKEKIAMIPEELAAKKKRITSTRTVPDQDPGGSAGSNPFPTRMAIRPS